MRCPDLRIFPKNIKFKRIFFVVIVLLVVVSAYFIISLPEDPRKVNIAIDVPAETEALPFDVIYRSSVCKNKHRDSNFRTYYEDGSRYIEIKPKQRGNSTIYEWDIALDDGGYCQWKLSNVRIGFNIKKDSALLNGIARSISESITLVFDDHFPSVSTGNKSQDIYGELVINKDYYPLKTEFLREYESTKIAIKGEQEFLTYKLYNPSKVLFKPNFYANKLVTAIQPLKREDGYKIIYPNGVVRYADISTPLDFGLLKE